MKFKIDVIRVRENHITLNGWVVGKSPAAEVEFLVRDEAGAEVSMKYVPTRRDDVSMIYFKKVVDRDLGFDITFDYERGKTYSLCIICEGQMKRVKFNEELIARRTSVAYKRREKIRDLCNLETLKVVWDNLRENGLKAVYIKSRNKLKGIDNDYEYGEWYDKVYGKKTHGDGARVTFFQTAESLQRENALPEEALPVFSIVIPVFETPDNYLKELLDSLLNQTYGRLEICIADGSRAGKSKEKLLREYAQKDPRVRYEILGENRGIAGNTNAALDMATGDYVVLCDHDDVVPEYAMGECARAAIEHPEWDCFYTDEDKMDVDGGGLFDPHFKPDFNIDLLRSVNYICHLFAFKRSILEADSDILEADSESLAADSESPASDSDSPAVHSAKTGAADCPAASAVRFDSNYDGAQDYDFIFRVTEKSQHVGHIPKICYHWRCHMNSTASNPESKLYAFENGAKAIKAHYSRVLPEIKIERIEKGEDYGIYHTFFTRPDPEPLISVVIPNKDHTADLDKAIKSVTAGSYKNLEFIIVENNSVKPETWTYYEEIQKAMPNVKVCRYTEPGFNFSRLNNFGVQFAHGDYYLFMNNDVEMINPDSIHEMYGYAQRADVGIVGCKLLYEDDSIQHAGVVIGFGGIAGHTFIGLYDFQKSYFHRAVTAQDYSAVTAACLLTKRSVFEAAGGFSEDLAVAFNDIDYCLKVRSLDKLVVYNPYANFHHYESKSRGLEDTPDKVDRFNHEVAKFMKKWPEILRDGDPYYNPNLTLRKSNFALRDLMKEKIGEPYHMEGIEKYLEDV